MQANEDTQAIVLMLVWYAIVCCGMARIFRKAGRSQWRAFVPVVNAVDTCRIAGVSGWWLAAVFVPLLNLVAALYVGLKLTSRFGRSDMFGVALVLSGFTLLPVLGFGRSAYRAGPDAALPLSAAELQHAGPKEVSGQRESRIRMIVLSVVYGVALLCIPGLLIVGTMAFAGITSAQKPAAELSIAILALTPISLLIALIGGWFLHRQHHYRTAVSLVVLPLLNIAGAIAGFLMVVGR